LISPLIDQQRVIEGCQTAGIGCIDCKKILFYHLEAFIAPIRERYQNLIKHPDTIKKILISGAQKAE